MRLNKIYFLIFIFFLKQYLLIQKEACFSPILIKESIIGIITFLSLRPYFQFGPSIELG